MDAWRKSYYHAQGWILRTLVLRRSIRDKLIQNNVNINMQMILRTWTALDPSPNALCTSQFRPGVRWAVCQCPTHSARYHPVTSELLSCQALVDAAIAMRYFPKGDTVAKLYVCSLQFWCRTHAVVNWDSRQTFSFSSSTGFEAPDAEFLQHRALEH